MLGVIWVLFQPVAGVALFTLVISNWLKLPEQSYPYALFAFSGLIVWNFFSYIVSAGGSSLTDSRQLIQRLSFPKIVLPLSKIIVGFIDFFISLVVLIIAIPIAGLTYKLSLLALPFFAVFIMLTGLSVSLWLAALSVRYRDFYHIIPYLIGFGIWLTPVFYPLSIVPQQFSWVIGANPVAFVAEGFRWCLFGAEFSFTFFVPAIMLPVLLLVSGLFYFRSIEKQISDTV